MDTKHCNTQQCSQEPALGKPVAADLIKCKQMDGVESRPEQASKELAGVEAVKGQPAGLKHWSQEPEGVCPPQRVTSSSQTAGAILVPSNLTGQSNWHGCMSAHCRNS